MMAWGKHKNGIVTALSCYFSVWVNAFQLSPTWDSVGIPSWTSQFRNYNEILHCVLIPFQLFPLSGAFLAEQLSIALSLTISYCFLFTKYAQPSIGCLYVRKPWCLAKIADNFLICFYDAILATKGSTRCFSNVEKEVLIIALMLLSTVISGFLRWNSVLDAVAEDPPLLKVYFSWCLAEHVTHSLVFTEQISWQFKINTDYKACSFVHSKNSEWRMLSQTNQVDYWREITLGL